ncbi:MAG: DUF1761 domain-containing protein [Saprospiraceae bacterium]|nr:DUF1761 domain-containing protein [Saprospiraceae bacterium]
MRNTNWLAIAAAVVAGMAIGFLWYGALFQNQWMAGNGISMNGDITLKDGVEQPMSSMPMIANTLAMVIYAIFMDWLIFKTNDTTWAKGATLGLILGLVMLVGVYVGNLFAMAPMSLSMVDGSYSLVLFTAMGAIIGGWRKK